MGRKEVVRENQHILTVSSNLVPLSKVDEVKKNAGGEKEYIQSHFHQ